MRVGDISQVIIQAGGMGTRLKQYTRNKPKALVPVFGQPLLYHFFAQWPKARFVIILSHQAKLLRTYLEVRPPQVDYRLIVAPPEQVGTIAGLNAARAQLGPGPLVLSWCDLFLAPLSERQIDEKNYLGLTNQFPCRWSMQNGQIANVKSSQAGIAGFFIFRDPRELDGLPEAGELVKWIADTPRFIYEHFDLGPTQEFGDAENLAAHYHRSFSRYFNDVKIVENRVIKQPRTREAQELLRREVSWYEYAAQHNFNHCPQLLSREPLTVSRLPGAHPIDLELNPAQKELVLRRMLEILDELHSIEMRPYDQAEALMVYEEKTKQRVLPYARLIPFFDAEAITINGRPCINILRQPQRLKELVNTLPRQPFTFIHGDPTFSNTFVDDNLAPRFFDPRGYFGQQDLFGDPLYDFAKVYYSVAGNYDAFNRKDFELRVEPETKIELTIKSNGWEQAAATAFAAHFSEEDYRAIRLLHGLIWLSLAGYVPEDLDSLLGAFYNGLYHLQEFIDA